MKDIRVKLIELFKIGYCTPQIARLAKKLGEPASTLHYNIKKLEEEGVIKAYKAVFNYKKINQGHCTFLLADLPKEDYGNPEKIAKDLSKYDEVESIDIVTGEYEILIKLRSKDVDAYYEFVRAIVQKYKFAKVISLTSLKQVKTEFVII